MSPPVPARRAPPPRWADGRGRARRRLLGVGVLVAMATLPPVLIVGGAIATVLAVRGWRLLRRRAAMPGARNGGAVRAGAAVPVVLGAGPDGGTVSLGPDQLAAHGLILGASGSGKTTTLLAILTQQIEAGAPVVAIDLKGSPSFAAGLAAAAVRAGRPLRVWSPDGPETWNPLAHGNATERKDKLMATEHFTEPHYRRAAERYVQLALGVRDEIRPGVPADLAEVVDLLEPRRLLALARGLSPDREAQIADYLQGLGPDGTSAVRGLAARLAVLSESTAGPWLAARPGGIDLRAALAGPEVVVLSLQAGSYGGLAAQLGTLAIQDLVAAAGARERDGATQPAATVAIDEFSALGAAHVSALIARARSAGVSVLLSTQELADLDQVSPSFRRQVLGSTAVKIAHRQDVPESAVEVARLAGTVPGWEESYSRVEGGRRAQVRVSARPVETWVVDPTQVQDLPRGEAVVITKLPRSQARLTRIAPARPTPGLGSMAPGDRRSGADRGR